MTVFSRKAVRGACAAAAMALLGAAGAARADVTWLVNGTFDDGGTLAGTITMNGTGMSNYSLTTAGGTMPAFTFDLSDSYATTSGINNFVFDRTAYPGDPAVLQLHIAFVNSLLTPAATDPIASGKVSWECQNSFQCPATESQFSGSAIRYLSGAASTAVPEPAAWAMMLVGFSGLGALLRRQRSATALAA